MEVAHHQLPVSVSLIHPGRIDTPYNEHAANYMPMQPVHRGMVYPPEAVAEAILWCAAHPTRDMFVGSQAKFGAMLGGVMPGVTDKVMVVHAYTSHQSRTRPPEQPPQGALYRAGAHARERGSHEPGLLRTESLWVKASKRPLATLAAVAGLGWLAAAALRPATRLARV